MNLGALKEAQRKEKGEVPLQVLPQGFYEELSEYFSAKTRLVREARSRDGEFKDEVAEQHENELKNARSLFLELLERRLRKIISIALEAADEDNDSGAMDTAALAPLEKGAFESVFTRLRDGKKAMLSTVFFHPAKKQEQEPTIKNGGKIMVRLKGDVPSFVGSDTAVYGPYRAGETAQLPAGNARLLVEKGRAEEVKQQGEE